MTLRRMVADMVIENGGASADTLLPVLSEFGYTRHQIMCALYNALACGWITCDRSTIFKGGRRGTRRAAMYYPPQTAMAKVAESLVRTEEKRGLVSSVFELGSPKPESAWPKASGVVYQPLGPWRSAEEAVDA